MIGVHHEVVEVVGGPHHGNRNIIVIMVRVLQINLLTVVCDSTQLKGNLFGQSPVFCGRDFISCGRHIDQSANNARLGIRDLDRLVGTHNEERFEPVRVGRTELLIHSHHLMRDQAVNSGIILNAGKVTIMLDCHQGV